MGRRENITIVPDGTGGGRNSTFTCEGTSGWTASPLACEAALADRIEREAAGTPFELRCSLCMLLGSATNGGIVITGPLERVGPIAREADAAVLVDRAAGQEDLAHRVIALPVQALQLSYSLHTTEQEAALQTIAAALDVLGGGASAIPPRIVNHARIVFGKNGNGLLPPVVFANKFGAVRGAPAAARGGWREREAAKALQKAGAPDKTADAEQGPAVDAVAPPLYVVVMLYRDPRREEDPAKKYWSIDLPGGKRKLGEVTWDCARREAHEELRIVITDAGVTTGGGVLPFTSSFAVIEGSESMTYYHLRV